MTFYNGKWADPKSNVPHLASALADLAILVDAYEANALNDDRPPKVDMHGLLDRFELITKHLHEMHPDGPNRYTELIHGREAEAETESDKAPEECSEVEHWDR